ncbi:UNVERIFIED_CONTAM: hypothetical protein NCL1_36914 [Trichonephila clavipes]
MERLPKNPITLRCKMERGDVLRAGLFVRRLFEYYDCFSSGKARCSLRTLSSPHRSNAEVVPWWTIGVIMPNFFSTLQLYLILFVLGLLEEASIFPSADPFR